MKKHLIKACQPFLSKCGLLLLQLKDFKRQQQREQLLISLINNAPSLQNKEIETPHLEFIIFSKDRALQLHGLLSSMNHHLSGSYSVQVIYCASSEAHQKAYAEIEDSKEFSNLPIIWHQEIDFRKNLIEILRKGKGEKICYLVDDIVFIRPVNLEPLNPVLQTRDIVSLRLGRGIDFCYTKQKPMNEPTLSNVEALKELWQFSWNEGQHDWAYPLSVDGHIFSRYEMSVFAEHLDFRAPNSFERALQLMAPLYLKRNGYCFESPRILNIPLNRVQDEKNNISADVNPEFLLSKWNKGLMLDYKKLEGIATRSVHKELQVSFCQRVKEDAFE